MTVRSAAAALTPRLWPWRLAGPKGRTPAVPRGETFDLADSLGRIVICVLFTLLAVRVAQNFLETGRITGLLLLAGELLVIALTVLRRAAVTVDRSWRARLLTGLSLAGPPLVQPLTAGGLLTDAVTATLSAAGLLVSVGGKLSLGRSFGLMPANRGIVSSGLYRAVRHPIYAGYLVTHVAFLIAHPSIWNVAVIVIADAALMARAVCEERTLAGDPGYRAYLDQVRWRVVPGVF